MFIDKLAARTSTAMSPDNGARGAAAQAMAAPQTGDTFYHDELVQLSSAPLGTPSTYSEPSSFSNSELPPKTVFKDEEIPF